MRADEERLVEAEGGDVLGELLEGLWLKVRADVDGIGREPGEWKYGGVSEG